MRTRCAPNYATFDRFRDCVGCVVSNQLMGKRSTPTLNCIFNRNLIMFILALSSTVMSRKASRRSYCRGNVYKTASNRYHNVALTELTQLMYRHPVPCIAYCIARASDCSHRRKCYSHVAWKSKTTGLGTDRSEWLNSLWTRAPRLTGSFPGMSRGDCLFGLRDPSKALMSVYAVTEREYV